jgi:hypothetical protein
VLLSCPILFVLKHLGLSCAAMGFVLKLVCCLAAVHACDGFRALKRSKSNATVNDLLNFDQKFTRSGAAGGNGGSAFDHWNYDRLAGAISKVCVRSGSRVDRLTVHYAGREKLQGGGGGSDRGCFSLGESEFITKVWLRAGSRLDAIQFTTSHHRVSPTYGGGGGGVHVHYAPAGTHLMGFFGRSGHEVDKLGLVWGRGGGSGQWSRVHSCTGCGPLDYKVQRCSERSGSTSKQVTSAWSVSVAREMSAGFSFKGASAGTKTTITASYSRETVHTESSSFTNTRCTDKATTCDKTYLWQWTFSSNFDNLGPVVTRGHYACTDEPVPCCMPGTFSTNPRKCDLNPRAPNTCR